MQKNDFGGNWHSLLEKIIYKLKAHSVYEPLTYIGRECKNCTIHIISTVKCFHS